MKRAWQGACIAFFLVFAFALANAFAYPMFDSLGPGPGFFPVWLSALGAVLALVLLVEVTWGHIALPAGAGLIPDGAGTRRVLAILGFLVLAALLLDPLGFRLTMLLFMVGLPAALGVRNYPLLAGLGLAGSFGVFQVFYYVLRVPLPIGVFGIREAPSVDALQYWLQGLAVATSPENLLFALVGCVLGTVIGVLPGLGPAAGTAILIPLTFNLPPIPAIIMLSAIYYGAMYGGTITSVLVNVPGEAASVVTCIDGYQMAKQGRGGAALGIAAIGSFVGGTVGTVLLMVVALPLAGLALRFGPPETFALLLLGLSLVTTLAGRSLLAALVMTAFGLTLALVGMDPVRGAPRFTFGIPDLYDGVGFVPVVMGLFGIGEILAAAERPFQAAIKAKLSDLLPRRDEYGDAAGAIGRGTVLGFALGLVPGIGAIVPTFLSYILEKRVSRHPERFGRGAIEGVAGPETANNAYATGSMVPLLAIGIPGSPALAVLMGAFIVNGITPGPFLFQERPDLVWGVIASFYVGNAMLLVLNLPLVGIWTRLLAVRYEYLFTGILLFCILGAYSLSQSTFDVGLMLVFGVVGYVLRKIDWPLTPAVLALLVGPLLERALRASLEMSAGDLLIFASRPGSALLLVVAALVLVTSLARAVIVRRAAALTQPGAS